MTIDETIKQLENFKVWESDQELINEIIEDIKELDNLKKEVVFFMKQHEQATRSISRLRRSLNDETEQKLELLIQITVLRKEVSSLALVIRILIEFIRDNLGTVDDDSALNSAIKVLENKS